VPKTRLFELGVTAPSTLPSFDERPVFVNNAQLRDGMTFTPKCERCEHPCAKTMGSTFNAEQICEVCRYEEERHPLFGEARRREIEALNRGYFDFEGIGLPTELRLKDS